MWITKNEQGISYLFIKKLSKSVLLIQVSNNVKSLIENINLILLYHDSH